MVATSGIPIMDNKLPEISRSLSATKQGFHGFRPQVVMEDVHLEFEDENQTKFPQIDNGPITSQTGGDDEDDDKDRSIHLDLVSEAAPAKPAREVTLPFCTPCGEKAAMETGRLTEKIMELKLEAERNRTHYDTIKRKLDNTFRELKTAQAMIVTLKSQNSEKANRIANLTREATIGLWAREKKKLLQFADVREASLEYELSDLKATSNNFKNRALDRIQFLHDQVYKLRLKLTLQSGPGKMTKLLDAAEKNLAHAKDHHRQELNDQKEEFFQYRKAMVGMLAGFHKDFRWLTNTVCADTNMASIDFFDLSEKFESTLGKLYKSSQEDQLMEKVKSLPKHFLEGATIHNMKEQEKAIMSEVEMLEQRKQAEKLVIEGMDDLTEAEALEKLEKIEQALKQSSKDLESFDELSLGEYINDSGVSLNEFPISRLGSSNESTEKVVRFEDETHADSDYDSGQNIKRKKRKGQNDNSPDMFHKAIQTDFLPELNSGLPPSRSGKGKRSKKSRSTTPNNKKKRTPKKIEPTLRLKQDQEFQQQWLSRKQNEFPDIKSSKSTPEAKKRTNTMTTFTHLRELYAEKRICSLIDRTTGVVNLEKAEEQFPSLSQGEVLDGFAQFVMCDSNNDFRLDIHEMVRAVSRTADEVIDPEEIKMALFELGVLESDELDFFDFLCIQETLSTGAFDKSKSKMLRLQSLSSSKKTPISKYCALM